jgi:predicted house-cleaning noncanonical NTP pyrophosphatase (MazG superfamily)
MKKLISFVLPVVFLAVFSCNSDRKKETVTNYIRVIWNVKSDDKFELVKLEEVDTITAKDSLDLLVKEYSEGAKILPAPDSLIANYEKDDVYNSNLLTKTMAKIDSFKSIKSDAGDNSFYLEYVKSLERLRDFTKSELAALRAEKNLLKKYSSNPTEVLSHKVVCLYKVRNHLPDTASRMINQTFYLSKDTRKILAVK